MKQDSKNLGTLKLSTLDGGDNSSTRWILSINTDKTVSFSNLKYRKGDRWLDGNTGLSNVGLRPAPAYTGTKWNIVQSKNSFHLECRGHMEGLIWAVYDLQAKQFVLSATPSLSQTLGEWFIKVWEDPLTIK